MTCFRLFSFTSHMFILFWVSVSVHVLQLLTSTEKKSTIHKMSFSLSLNGSVYTSETQVCTQKCWSPVSTLLSKKSGSTLMCEWRCALLFLTLLPSSQYTNTIPQPAVWCGNSIHISCQPERFLSLIYVLHGWGKRVTPHLCPPAVKAFLHLRNRRGVWFQLGCR